MHAPFTHTHPACFSAQEKKSRDLFSYSSRLFFQIRQTARLRKQIANLQLDPEFVNISQEKYDEYVDLEDGADHLVETQCQRRLAVVLERIKIAKEIASAERRERIRRENEYLTRHCVSVFEHCREGGEADGDIVKMNEAVKAERERNQAEEAEIEGVLKERSIMTAEEAFESRLQQNRLEEAVMKGVDENIMTMEEAADWELLKQQQRGESGEETVAMEEALDWLDWELDRERKRAETNESILSTQEATQAGLPWEPHANHGSGNEASFVIVGEESDGDGVVSLDEDDGQEWDEGGDLVAIAHSKFADW